MLRHLSRINLGVFVMDNILGKPAQDIGELIFAYSAAHSEQLEILVASKLAQPGWQLEEPKFKGVVLEFTALLLHVSDRIAFEVIGPKRRSQLIDGVLEVVNSTGTTCSLSQNHPQPPFVSSDHTNITVVGVNTNLLNTRQQEYSGFLDFQRGDELNHTGALTWRFGVHVSEAIVEPRFDADIQRWARTMAIESYAAIIPRLRKILGETIGE
jgi:hypothetical protein